MIEHGLLSFGSLLREKMDELDADDASQELLAVDPVERLRLDARQAVMDDQDGPMQRGGHQAYIDKPAAPVAPPGQRHLNILH